MYMIYKSNIRYIFCKEPFKGQVSEDKSTPLPAIKHYSFLNLAIFFCTIIILCKWNYKSLAYVMDNSLNNINGI